MCPICYIIEKLKNLFNKEEKYIHVPIPDHINELRWKSGKRELMSVMRYTEEDYCKYVKEYGTIEAALLNLH